MKKIIVAIFVIALSAVLLTACGKTEATKQVEALIKAIGSDVGLQSEDAINAALNAYDRLTDEEKDKVGNYKKLEKAKADYDKLAGLNDYIAAMVDSAGTSFSKDDFDVSGLIDQYDEMVSLYEGLKDGEKAQIVGYDQLEDAIAQLKDYDTAAQESAAAYVKGFMEVYKDKGYTVTAVGCIKQIREDKEYHFFALTYKDKEGNEHNAYSTARFVGANVINTIIARPDIFFAEAPATEDTDCLTHGNVTIDVEAAIAAAEKLTVDTVPAATAAPETTQPPETTQAPAEETETDGETTAG